MNLVRLVIKKFDDCKNEILGLVERVQYFVFGDRYGVGSGNTAFYFKDTALEKTLLSADPVEMSRRFSTIRRT